MILILNGQPYDTAAGTVAQLLEEKGIDADGTAVALSEQVVPRSVSYTHLTLPTICSV